MPDPKRERDRWRTEKRQLRQQISELHKLHGRVDPAYAAILNDLHELAYYGCRRPTDLGGPVMSGAPSSRPPSIQPNRAYDMLRRELADQRRRSAELRRKMERLIDGDDHLEAPISGRVLAEGF